MLTTITTATNTTSYEIYRTSKLSLFVEPACGERDIHCSCYNFISVHVRALCVRLSGFVQTITSTFMHGFQNNLAQFVLLEK